MASEWTDTTAPARRPRVAAATFGLLVLGCATTAPPAARVTSLVNDWFALLEAPTTEPGDFERHLAAPSFEVAGEGGHRLGVPELQARHRELHATYAGVEYRVGDLHVEPTGAGLYTARFEVERRAVDSEGIPHLQRKQVSWQVRAGAGANPVILRVEERALLPHPGSGTRIVCY